MFAQAKSFLLQVLSDFTEDDCPSMAAALAYATLFSLPSLLLIIIYVAGLVLGPEAASGQIQARLSSVMGAQASGEIQTMVANIANNTRTGIIATVLGIAGLVLSAMSVLLQLQSSLNRAWKVTVAAGGMRGFVMKRLRSALLLLGGGLLAIVSVAATSVLTALARLLPYAGAVHVLTFIISLLAFAVIFAAILKVMPDVHIEWRDVWVGGLFIAALFEIGKFLIAFYLGHLGKTSVYGAAGSLALILLWTYYSALVFLLGVELTQVWVRSQGRKVRPKQGAKRVEQERPAVSASAANS
ncbi:MAG TPA: YihY/virulence factor BrkB family protein [Candidatus Binataceae bacterium]|jgi:membrane protein|nr:YihY/virulence factor BrkB family protein [Candidatus Binataceae bacterium]